jgi:DnaK suppressor protein
MATKPKLKPEIITESIPPVPKPAPKKVPKAAAETTSAAPEKDSKVAAKTKSAMKVIESKEPKEALKTPEKVASKPSAKSEHKSVKKPEIKALNNISSPIAVQTHKWQEIRTILEKIKEDTLREINKSVKNGTDAVATNEPGGDIYDQASSERDRELGLLLGDREREKLHSIDEALLRIDEDEYGICEECDEDIPLGRLKAMPFTRHCVKCKSDLEKLQAQTRRFEEDRAYREIPLGSEEDEA